MRFQFSVFDLITQLVYARVISPCSKSKTASHVFPYLYGSSTISEYQVYDWCSYFLIALIITLKLISPAMTSKRELQKYHGNESEKPYIRKVIEEMKQRHNVSDKTIKMADKVLFICRKKKQSMSIF